MSYLMKLLLLDKFYVNYQKIRFFNVCLQSSSDYYFRQQWKNIFKLLSPCVIGPKSWNIVIFNHLLFNAVVMWLISCGNLVNNRMNINYNAYSLRVAIQDYLGIKWRKNIFFWCCDGLFIETQCYIANFC